MSVLVVDRDDMSVLVDCHRDDMSVLGLSQGWHVSSDRLSIG